MVSGNDRDCTYAARECLKRVAGATGRISSESPAADEARIKDFPAEKSGFRGDAASKRRFFKHVL
ncbi:hypothetical protein A3C20_00820 [Candidatus Kaiserbacteria bacterium RIFCSPHIGHO2_02_FULL_55_25]|uniref:Uncharacterized protein n=1 Tax=Candidatus Kaiserbacteria bacterium RIFCSPHIGHO2_02_FULL_55_25 TaxID=1798498 RepID=A0A1F6E7A7_9BACT|nr:MAG: hypothetical protein A3C20_00820 [Candidatus Kaiserbacteria bacterium RIFCSPHIGHO2_02_FULL_55_25]OGG78598.1 MAG: hypothetical protein A3F56_03755 [Candidatus Kaiserbacteria bacterium RIFCSPHIGHO2_12_FULL_55_13]OGG83095.1 MAG: hypothetical protein A3A42_00530 [Candidatus Kaiserbacteria bacterium RIFCSPLOWO2_01_FULL_55_25]